MEYMSAYSVMRIVRQLRNQILTNTNKPNIKFVFILLIAGLFISIESIFTAFIASNEEKLLMRKIEMLFENNIRSHLYIRLIDTSNKCFD